MSSNLKARGALLAVVVLAAGLWYAYSRPDPSTPQAGDIGLESDTPDRARPRQANAMVTAPLPAPRGHRALAGHVVDARGPVAGALVILTADGGEDVLSDLPCMCDNRCGQRLLECGCGQAAAQLVELVLERRGEAPPIARTVSDDTGAFVFQGLEAGRHAIWAEKTGTAIGALRGLQDGEQDVTITISAGLTLRGKIVGDDGEPVAGAAVTAIYSEHARFFDTLSAIDGSFTLAPVPRGVFSVVASAAGRLPAHGRAGIGESSKLNLKLFTPRQLSGRVLRGEDAAAGISVSLEGEHRKSTATTDESGAFSFTGLRPGDYTLIARGALEVARSSVEVQPGKDRKDVRLELGSGGEISGGVTSDSGAPVADAEVSAVSETEARSGRIEVRTAADGTYRIGPVRAGFYHLTPNADGYLSGSSRKIEVQAGQVASLALTLRAASPLRGVVRDLRGKPVEGAVVYAVRAGQGRRAPAGHDDDDGEEGEDEPSTPGARGSGRSKRDGSFDVDGLQPGTYEVRVTHDDFTTKELSLTAPTTTAVIQLDAGLEVTGVVLDENAAPVEGANVELTPSDRQPGDTATHAARSEVDGRFVVRGLTEKRYSATASLDADGTSSSRRTPSIDVDPRRAGTAQLRLQFIGGQSITGTVTDRAGAPVADAEIMAFPSGSDDLPQPVRVHGDTDGTFALTHLAPGRYELLAHAEKFSPTPGRVSAQAGDRDVKLVLTREGRIRGRVVDESGAPIPSFKINLKPFEAADGRFEYPASPRGQTELHVHATGYAQTVRKVKAKPDESVDIPDVVMVKGRSLSGLVIDAHTNAPVVGALVDCGEVDPKNSDSDIRLAEELGAARTGADGRFVLAHVESRPMTLFAVHPQYRMLRRPLGIEETEVSLAMNHGVSLFGTVQDASGAPVTDLVVLVQNAQGTLGAKIEDDGSYRVDGLLPGKAIVGARAARPWQKPKHVFPPREIELPAEGELRLDLREATGGAKVQLTLPGNLVNVVSLLVAGDVPAPQDFREFIHIQASVVPDSDPFKGVFRKVQPGAYTAFILDGKDGPTSGKLRIARTLVQVTAEAEQVIALPTPDQWSDLGFPGAGAGSE